MDEIRNEKMTSLVGASSEEIARAIAEVMDDMKAHDIKILRVSEKTAMALPRFFRHCRRDIRSLNP